MKKIIKQLIELGYDPKFLEWYFSAQSNYEIEQALKERERKRKYLNEWRHKKKEQEKEG